MKALDLFSGIGGFSLGPERAGVCALNNSIIPQIAEMIGRAIMKAKSEK